MKAQSGKTGKGGAGQKQRTAITVHSGKRPSGRATGSAVTALSADKFKQGNQKRNQAGTRAAAAKKRGK